MQTLPSKSVQQIVDRHHVKNGQVIQNNHMQHFIEYEIIAQPIAYIAGKAQTECFKLKINDQLYYQPPDGPESTFYTLDVGIALAKGSKLTPYMNFV